MGPSHMLSGVIQCHLSKQDNWSVPQDAATGSATRVWLQAQDLVGKGGIVADSLSEGARGCRRMHEPGKMSARFLLEDAFGMASAKPVRSSGVFIRMRRHLSSCIHAKGCLCCINPQI